MEEQTNQEPTNIVPLPEQPKEQQKPVSIRELVANVDLTGLTPHEIIVDLIAGIQQLAVRGTIALGLLSRIKERDDAACCDKEAESPAESDAEKTNP